MKSKILFLFLLCLAVFSSAQVSLDKINLEMGTYQVGFQHYLSTDSTRTYQRVFDWTNQKIPRPIPVSIWYPSIQNSEKETPISILDYLNILKEEEEWEHLPDEQILNWFYYPNTAENRKHLPVKTSARLNATPILEPFPVILYAPSYEASSIENFALCEYLTSHGYVVISSPSRGTENRYLAGGSTKDVETQARDIEFLISEIAKQPNADLNKVATMGFSFGGLSNVLAQMKNDYIKAIVSLDGSIKYNYKALQGSPFADIKKVDVPFIHMAQKDIPRQVLLEDKIDSTLNTHFDFFDDLVNSQAYSFKFHDLTHTHFSTLGVFFQPRDKRQDKSDAAIMASYKWVSIYTLQFLNAFLKQDSSAHHFIENDPEINGIKEGLVSKKSKSPQPKAFTFQDFNERALGQNYDNLYQLYTSVHKKHPSFAIPEGRLNNLGLQLVFNPKSAQYGIKVLQFAIQLYPKSANLYDSLAEAYLFLKNEKAARINFQKSLELYPENQNAIKRLKELKKE